MWAELDGIDVAREVWSVGSESVTSRESHIAPCIRYRFVAARQDEPVGVAVTAVRGDILKTLGCGSCMASITLADGTSVAA